MKYQDEIIKIIQNVIKLTEPIEDIKIDTNLRDVGIDSITFVVIVVEIEKYFNIEFPDEKLVITQAGTIKKLCKIIMEAKCEEEESV